MAITTNFRITGLEEARTILKKLPEKIQTRVLRSSVRAGAAIALKAVKANAPVATKDWSEASLTYGQLKDNIRLIRLKRGPKSWAGYRVDTGNAFWGLFLEFGTSRMAARPWFRPAVDTAAEAGLERMRERLIVGIEREALKLAGEYPTKGRR